MSCGAGLDMEEISESEYQELSQTSSHSQFQNEYYDSVTDTDGDPDYEDSQDYPPSSDCSSHGFSQVRPPPRHAPSHNGIFMEFYYLQGQSFSQDDENFFGKKHIEDSKSIVYIPLLLALFEVCNIPTCGAAVDPENISWSCSGAMITVKATCNSNHSFTWSSSPMMGSGKSKVAAINVLIGTYAYICGVNIKKVRIIFHFYK